MNQASSVDQTQRNIGERLKDLRLAAGMTQKEAAQAAQIDYKRWHRLEVGEVNTTVKTLVCASRAVGESIWALFRD